MKTSVNFVRKVHNNSSFFEEDNLLSNPAGNCNSQLLDIFCFGHSLFRKGANIHILQDKWVVQFQISGETEILTKEGKLYLEPGDLLISPPNVDYTFHVPQNTDMTKYYLIFCYNPLLEILLGKEIRQHGMKIKPLPNSAIQSLLEQIRDTFEKTESPVSEQLSVLLYTLVCKIRNAIQMSGTEGPFYQKLNLVTNKFMNRTITLDDLSQSFGVGKFTLIREFKKRTGMSPVAYMISVRLEYARQLLLLSDMTISEIAECCGYSSATFFVCDFRKHTGTPPGQYRLKYSKKQENYLSP